MLTTTLIQGRIHTFFPRLHSDFQSTFEPMQIRPTEPVSAKLLLDSKYYTLPIWFLSPFGLELASSNKLLLDSIISHKEIKLLLSMGNTEIYYNSVSYTDHTYCEEHECYIIAISLQKKRPTPHASHERRLSHRWNCPKTFLPFCTVMHPYLYGERLYFSIHNLSVSGLMLTTHKKNAFLLPGLVLQSTFIFSETQQFKVKIKIKRAAYKKYNNIHETLELGAVWIALTQKHKSIIADYLIKFNVVKTLEILQSYDFPAPYFSKGVTFSYAQNEHEYEQILVLRKLAYLQDGKASSTHESEHFISFEDTFSRLIIGKYADKIVVSSALHYCNENRPTQYEQLTNCQHVLPSKKNMVESSKTCIHPHFRASDLLISIFHFIMVITIQSEREWILISSTEKLKHLYIKLTFKEIGFQFNDPMYNWIPHRLYLLNLKQSMLCKTAFTPFVWQIMISDILQYLVEKKQIQLDPLAYARIGFVKLFTIFTPIIQQLLNQTYRYQEKLNADMYIYKNDSKYQGSILKIVESILSIYDNKPIQITHLGAGIGHLVAAISQIIPESKINYIDHSPLAKLQAKAHNATVDEPKRKNKVLYICQPLVDIHFKDKSQDLIIWTHFAHSTDTATLEVLLEKIWYSLEPNGHLMFATNLAYLSPISLVIKRLFNKPFNKKVISDCYNLWISAKMHNNSVRLSLKKRGEWRNIKYLIEVIQKKKFQVIDIKKIHIPTSSHLIICKKKLL